MAETDGPAPVIVAAVGEEVRAAFREVAALTVSLPASH